MEFIRDLLHGQPGAHTHEDGTLHSHGDGGNRADYSPSDEAILWREFYLGIAGIIVSLILLKLLASPIVPVVLLALSVLLTLPRLILSVAIWRYAPRRFTLDVATFNERARQVYERAGFKPLETFTRRMNGGLHEFLAMYRSA